MMISIYEWKTIQKEDKERIMQRAQLDVSKAAEVAREWLDRIATEGDEAILDYIRTFDDPESTVDRLRVSEADIKEAYANVSDEVLGAIREQIRISRAYHEAQDEKTVKEWEIETVPGVRTGGRIVPVDAAGLYVPAGKAPLPTVAQILTVAAKVAGVPRAVVCFPPTAPNYEIIVAANEAGADEIYRVGGIAAIGAMTYGTDTIVPVNVIAGPGNPYVQAAKLQVFGKVGIDMLSGPSEALILADEGVNVRYAAAGVLARCEHGEDSAGVVATTSLEMAEQIKEEVESQALSLGRQEFIQPALENYSAILVFDSDEEMIEFANEYAAEHLVIMMKNPRKVLEKIRNAGSVFLGEFAPVAVGDYASGTNHCLPTGVAPKFASPVNVGLFQKKMEFQELTRDGLAALKPIVETISDVEGLDAHKRSVQIRFE
ncbi:histidinol dehydrogenase [Candidatus Peregrinibacteria bacterium]|jgi:histidinol dehydrogenase|nr:histidinol dehydrogenase [Candidatus Peregrinibacteria bacterium]MBT7703179.1 histidinol dehydrogenase [Candidatus Peregrinibacteria bacterium]